MVKIEKFIKRININDTEKISLTKCKQLNIIPFLEDNLVKVVCEVSTYEIKEYLSLVYNAKIEEIQEIKIDKNDFNKLKKYIFFDLDKNIEEEIIKNAILERASDIHFEPSKKGVNVRFRVDGVLNLKKKIQVSVYDQVLARIKNNSNLDITEKRLPQDGKMKFETQEIDYSLRISIINTMYGEKLVVRILREGLVKLDFQSLWILEKQKKILENLINQKEGLVIINGPTGSGKSTTLYSILDCSNNDEINITTLEDPIEVNIEGATQIALNKKIGLDFASALRSVLRQDPDIIMIGEIRDEETGKMAIRASITGHKVYSTIHARSPREVFFRLKEIGVDTNVLKSSLIGIISQRLIRKLCDSCKEEEFRNIKGKNKKVFKVKGCKKCGNSGYLGRVLVSEVVEINEDITEEKLKMDKSILSNVGMEEVVFTHLSKGTISYAQYLGFLSEEGIKNEKG